MERIIAQYQHQHGRKTYFLGLEFDKNLTVIVLHRENCRLAFGVEECANNHPPPFLMPCAGAFLQTPPSPMSCAGAFMRPLHHT
jgi:hypothetical protein